MPEFYHNSVTDKSFRFLKELNERYKFILIGGWAVFLYTRSLKSKDIDIILDYNQLGNLREEFTVDKNDRLKKYEIKVGEFDIDIYLAHYSELGLPCEFITNSAITEEGFLLPRPEVLFLLKLQAWQGRKGSIKGRKDEVDILSLAFLESFNWSECLAIIKKFNFKEKFENFIFLLKKTTNVPELNLNEQQISRLKKRVTQDIEYEREI